jgi:hypothetical protein
MTLLGSCLPFPSFSFAFEKSAAFSLRFLDALGISPGVGVVLEEGEV